MSLSRDSLEAILATALDAAMAMRPDGTIAAWNQVAEQTFGWSLPEVRGRKLNEIIIPPELRGLHDEGLERYLRTGVAKILGRHLEVIAIDRAGRRFPVELSTTEIPFGGERLFLGFVRDISHRKEAEKRAAEYTERLELAVGAHSIGVFDTDVRSERVQWSAELQKIYGYEPGKFEDNLDAWRSHVLPADLAVIRKQFENAISARAQDVTYSYRMKRADGVIRHIEASSRFFYDEDGNNVRRVGVNIDVTERKETERRLAETEAELIHLSRRSSLGALASSLSHELNQPLAALSNYITGTLRLLRRKEPTEAAIAALEQASENASRMGALMKRLRALSRNQNVDQQQVSLASVLHETAALAVHDNRLGPITLRVEIPDEVDAVFSDAVLLQQVFFNLLRNAAEAMAGSAGGEITVRALPSGEQVLIEVKDSGPGIDAEVFPTLFTAFETTKAMGMGVGLSICRTIIENQGGRIWAASRPDGATFLFTLPRYEDR